MPAAAAKDRAPEGFQSTDARETPMRRRAAAFFAIVAVAAVAATGLATAESIWPDGSLIAFAVLASLAAAAQLFAIPTGRNQRFHTAVVFIVAAALLLPPELVAAMAVLQHVPEWLRERIRPWYVQSFNICNYTLNALAAWGVAQLVGGTVNTALTGFAAAATFVALNHAALATMLYLARGHTFRESGLFSAPGLLPDLVLAVLGVALAALWRVDPWLAPALIAPLLLSHHSFSNLARVRESDERFRAMFESAATGTGLVSAEGRLLTSNPALRELLGRTESELRELRLDQLVHPDDVAAGRTLFDELMAGQRDSYRLEQRYLAADGAVVWAHEAVALVRDADARPEFAIAMLEDVSERKQAEHAVHESEARYRDLFENANDMVYTLDLDGRFTGFNRAGEEITGYERGELAGRRLMELLADRRVSALAQLSCDDARSEATTAGCTLVAKDGRHVSLEVASRLIRKDGEVVGIQGIARDVSEREELEARLRQGQKMEAVGRLAGGVAHDFNNLLTAIMRLQRARSWNASVRASDSAPSDVEEIMAAAERAAALTRQLLAFSRKQILAAEGARPERRRARPGQMLRRLIGEDIEHHDRARPGARTGRGGPRPARAGDRQPRRQRARRDAGRRHRDDRDGERRAAMRPRRAAPSRSSRAATSPLSIRDTGDGMDAETHGQGLRAVLHDEGPGKGTGLGLATVYGIVKQTGGHVYVDSEVGTGTVFTILLPPVLAAVAELAPAGGPAHLFSAGTETVLVVEDEEVIRRLVREVLEGKGYSILEAANGTDALDVSDRHLGSIELLLTDVVMPKMSGRELADRLRERRPHTRVLYMSGHTDSSIVHHGVLEPGTELLEKPFTFAALDDKVRAVLDEQTSPVGAR